VEVLGALQRLHQLMPASLAPHAPALALLSIGAEGQVCACVHVHMHVCSMYFCIFLQRAVHGLALLSVGLEGKGVCLQVYAYLRLCVYCALLQAANSLRHCQSPRGALPAIGRPHHACSGHPHHACSGHPHHACPHHACSGHPLMRAHIMRAQATHIMRAQVCSSLVDICAAG